MKEKNTASSSTKNRPSRVKNTYCHFRWIGHCLIEKVIPNNNYIVRKLNTNQAKILHGIRLPEYKPEKPLSTIVRKLNVRLTILLLFRKMICTTLHGRRNLEKTYLKFLLNKLTPTQVISMKVTHKDQILILSRALLFITQAKVKTGKLDGLLTHLWYILQILNRMVKVDMLRPLQTNVILMVQSKNLSQTWTLKPHMNLRKTHLGNRTTPIQRLRSTIIKPKLFRKTNLVFVEVVNTICALILILITQNYTDSDVCKNLFQPFQYFISTLHLFTFESFFDTHISFVLFPFGSHNCKY